MFVLQIVHKEDILMMLMVNVISVMILLIITNV